MITTADIQKLSELNELAREMGSAARKLTAKRDEAERLILEAIHDGQKVEAGSPYRLQIDTHEKRYSPSYKACAIELGGEGAVTEWCERHNPHETEESLEIVDKIGVKNKLSKAGRAVVDALAGFFQSKAKTRPRAA